MNSADLLPFVPFHTAKSVFSNFRLHAPSVPTPHVLEADLENKQRQIRKFPDFFSGSIKGLFSQSQAMLPETISKKKKSTDKGESNQSSVTDCREWINMPEDVSCLFQQLEINRQKKSWVNVKFQTKQMPHSPLTFIFTMLLKDFS